MSLHKVKLYSRKNEKKKKRKFPAEEWNFLQHKSRRMMKKPVENEQVKNVVLSKR